MPRFSKSFRIQLFQRRIPVYQKDPVLFLREVLKFEPDEFQREAAMDLAQNPRVAIKSGQGVGKTAFEAGIALWFLACFPYPRVVCTAPTRQQLHDVLWAEIAKWQANSSLLSEILAWTKTYVYMRGKEKRWFAVARTATKPENMQGFHEDNMLFIVDEASGVADGIMEAIKGTLSGANNKLLMCGNPTRTSGAFYDAFNIDRDMYKCHTISSLDSPRTNKEMLQSLIRKYGIDSNFVSVRILGEFAKDENDSFIPLSLLEKNIITEERTFATHGNTEKVIAPIVTIHIGCDVARYGDDYTVIGYRINERVKVFTRINGQDTVTTARNLAALALRLKTKFKFNGKVPIKIDDGGVGGGTVDALRKIVEENPDTYGFIMVVPVLFGKAINHVYYADTTTYMMSCLRDAIKTEDSEGNLKDPELILPNDQELIAQLSTRKYKYNGSAKQVVESKKDYKTRNSGQSPDVADCILLVALPVTTE